MRTFPLLLGVSAWVLLFGSAAETQGQPLGQPGRGPRPLLPPEALGVLTHVPSDAAGDEGVAVRVLPPRTPRYAAGAPVVIHVAGGVSAGGTLGRPEYAGLGFVEIRFAFPGGGDGEAASGGTYDYRGPKCTRALADVIRFATGRTPDRQGRKIGDLAPGLAVLATNCGLVGSSHGGNACGLVMARHGNEFPDLAFYASMESPYGEGAVNVELGGRGLGVNPAYDPQTGRLDLSTLAWSADLSPTPTGRPERGAAALRGALYFDLNGDGRFSAADDFPANVFVGDAGRGVKAYYSPRLIAEAQRRSLPGATWPSHLPTLDEAREFWRDRDAAESIPDAVRQCPAVAVIVYAGARDHVQDAPDHPHILAQVEGFRAAGARFIRLNPDRAYVERLLRSRPPAPARPDGAFCDNDAGKGYTRQTLREHLEPEGSPINLFMQAAVCELADRVQARDWSPNLDAVLFPQAPWSALPEGLRPGVPGAGPREALGPQRPADTSAAGRAVAGRGEAARPPAAVPGGPYHHKILSASSADGLTWTRDPGVRVEHASVPCAVTVGDRVLLYYVDADRGPGRPESVGCAVSTDGLHFEKQPFALDGLPATKAVDPCVLRDPDGAFRLYYFASSAPGDPAAESRPHPIHLARSEDGIHFREVGVAFQHPRLVDPDVFLFKGAWFMYVFGNGETVVATSPDGLRFTYKQPLALRGWGTVAPVPLDAGRLRLYAFDQRKPSANAVRSFLSTDGLAWTPEPGDRLVAGDDEAVTDPFVVRWKDGYKMYFKSEQRPVRPASLGPEALGREPRREGPPPEGPSSRRPAGVPGLPPPDAPGPWDRDVVAYRAGAEGPVEKLATFERAGVPTIARMKDGRLIVAHQHFPAGDAENFDKVAVRFSADEGRTWSLPEVIRLTGLPEGMRFPFDPTLVPLPDGRVRLYFTSLRGRRFDEDVPAIYSAVSANGVDYTVEPGVRFGAEGRPVIDCAVVLHQGVFHLYAPDNGAARRPGEPRGDPPAESRPREGVGFHATSRDGLAFTRADDVRVEGRRHWLGNAQSDGKVITFVGTGDPVALEGGPARGSLWMATSEDGQSWHLAKSPAVMGGDPGAVATTGGGWIIVITGGPRPGTPSARP